MDDKSANYVFWCVVLGAVAYAIVPLLLRAGH